MALPSLSSTLPSLFEDKRREEEEELGLEWTTYTPHSTTHNRERWSVEATDDEYSLASGESLFTITLQNRHAVDYTLYPATIQAVQCHSLQDVPYNKSFICPGGEGGNVTCPAHTKGIYNISCPGAQNVPLCKVYKNNAIGFTESPECNVTHYTAMNTTCRCKSSTTVYSTVGTSTLYQQRVTSSSKLVETLFTIVFTNYIPHTTEKPSGVITASMIFVFALFMLLLLFTIRHDKWKDAVTAKVVISALDAYATKSTVVRTMR
jgi:hypothetical protein